MIIFPAKCSSTHKDDENSSIKDGLQKQDDTAHERNKNVQCKIVETHNTNCNKLNHVYSFERNHN